MNRTPSLRRPAVLAASAMLVGGLFAAAPSVAGADSDDQEIVCTLNSPTDCTVKDPDGVARVEVTVPVEFGDGTAQIIDETFDCQTEVAVHFDVINPNFTFVVTDCSKGGGHVTEPPGGTPSKLVTPTTTPTGGRGPGAKLVTQTTPPTGGSAPAKLAAKGRKPDIGCVGFSVCNELIALCIGAGHEYIGDSDAGYCDTNDNGVPG